jgi:hypothetical protein
MPSRVCVFTFLFAITTHPDDQAATAGTAQ